MPSLIPAEVFAQMMLRNSMPNSLGMQPQGDLAPQMGQFMQAHRMRLNNSPTPSQGQSVAGPMADSLMRTRARQALAGTAIQNQQDAQQKRQERAVEEQEAANRVQGAGTMSIQSGSGKDGRAIMNPQRILEAGEKFNRENQIMGKSGEEANPVFTPLDQNFHLQPGSAQQVANQVTQAQHIGYNVTGAGQPQPAANPIHDLIAQHVKQHPDSLVNAMSQIPGMTAQQIIAQINHERGAKVAKQDNRHAEFSQNKSVYDEERRQDQEDQKYIENTGNDEKDPEVVRRKQAIAQRQPEENNLLLRMKGMVTPQQQQDQIEQGGQQKQRALNPQMAAQFLQYAGGDKNKARELARQAGWSF